MQQQGKTENVDSNPSQPLLTNANAVESDTTSLGDAAQKADDSSTVKKLEQVGDGIRAARDMEFMKEAMKLVNGALDLVKLRQFSVHSDDSAAIRLVKHSGFSFYFAFCLFVSILFVNIAWTAYVHIWDRVVPSKLFFVPHMLIGITTLGIFMILVYVVGCRRRDAFFIASFICCIMGSIQPNVAYFDSTIPDLFNHIPRKMMETHMFAIDRYFNLMTPILHIFKIFECHKDRDHPMCIQGLADISNFMPKYRELILKMGNVNDIGLPENVFGMRLPPEVHAEKFVGGNSETKGIVSYNLAAVRKMDPQNQSNLLTIFLSNRFRNGAYLEYTYRHSVSMYNTFKYGIQLSSNFYKWFDKSGFIFAINPYYGTVSRIITLLGGNGINFLLTTHEFENYCLEWINFWNYVVKHQDLPSHRVNKTLFLVDAQIFRQKDLDRVENQTFDMCMVQTCVTAQAIKSHNVKIAGLVQNLKNHISADQHEQIDNMTFNDMKHTDKVWKEKEKEKDSACPYTEDNVIANLLHMCPVIQQVTLLLATVAISEQPALATTLCPPGCLNTYVTGCAPIVEVLDNDTATLHHEPVVNTEDQEDSKPLSDVSWWHYLWAVLGYSVTFIQHCISMGFGYMIATVLIFLVLVIIDCLTSHPDEYWVRRRRGPLKPSHNLQRKVRCAF